MIKKKGKLQSMRNEEGFSLIELVVAVGILAILSVVGVVAYSSITENARKTAVDSAASEVLTGATAYDSSGDNYKKAEIEWKNSAANNSITVKANKGANGDICVVAENTDHDLIANKGAGCEYDNDGNLITTPGGNNGGDVDAPITGGDESEDVDYTISGFSMPLTVSVSDSKQGLMGQRIIPLSWTNETILNQEDYEITYKVESEDIGGKLKIRTALPYTGSNTSLELKATSVLFGSSEQSIRISITPYVNGVAGAPVVKDLWLDSSNNTWITDVE